MLFACKVTLLVLALYELIVSAQAFTNVACVTLTNNAQFSLQSRPFILHMSDEDTAPNPSEEVEKEEAVEVTRPVSGMSMQDVRRIISKLSKDNFSESLATIEPFLLHEAGATMYAKSMRRIEVQAKAIGAELPQHYALEAKATEKKRAKQNEFIQTKIAEAAAEAEASAAEAAAVSEVESAEDVSGNATAELTETVSETEPVAT